MEKTSVQWKMQTLDNMKFWHRVVTCVAVLGLVSLSVYRSLSNEMTSSEQHQQWRHRMMLRNADTRLVEKSRLPVDAHLDPEMCSLTSSGPPHYANISTYDLYYNTQFNVKSDGDWEIPLPTYQHRRAFRPPRLKVILVPHSHNDPGWLKTVNEYYSDQTRHILNNMVNKLTQYPNMTFIWTETIFFSIWWNELDDAVKVHVRRLIRRKQLEITLGGWVMPDEASSHYVAVIDQLIEGHQWLWENLAVRPENSWSIDPFGYSSTMPYLWQKAGMSNMVIQRVHQAVKASLMKHQALEFYWRQMWDGRGSTDIFCHTMPFMLYTIKYTCGPNQFTCQNFDFRQIVDDRKLPEYQVSEITNDNIEQRAEMLYLQYQAKKYYFRHNTILVPIGDDFRYDNEREWDQQYENYERLIQYMNSRSDWNVHAQWGTLNSYFEEIKKEQTRRKSANKIEEFPILSGDFFPYSDRDMAYWTGYYSTRPFDKYFGREVQSTLEAADILSTLHYAFYKHWNKNPDVEFSVHSSLLQQARRSLGLFLHHDAITGTSKSFVVDDYEQYLFRALTQSQEVIKLTLQSLLSNGQVETPVVFQPEIVRKSHTDLPGKQVIVVTESGTTVAFFNPLAQSRQQIVHLLVNTEILEIVSSSKQIVPCQIGPVWNREDDLSVLDNVFELMFLVETGPFSISSYTLYRKHSPPDTSYPSSITVINSAYLAVSGSLPFTINRPEPQRVDPIVVDNQVIQITFDPKTGSLIQVTDMISKNITKLNLTFQFYKSHGSGAYLFSPKGPSTNLFTDIPIFRISQGPLATTVIVTFGPHLTHTVTLYNQPTHLASNIFLENQLNIQPFKDKEIIQRLNTDIPNVELSYYTDQNGFQMIRRRTNKSQPTEANYYPMTSAAVLEDPLTRLTLLSAQPHGVSSLATGQLEVMLDRQPLYDDNRGMGEGVTDIKPTISRFIIVVEKRRSLNIPSSSHYTSISLPSLLASDILQQPLLAYFTTVDTPIFFRTVSPFPNALPCDIRTVSFRSLVNGNLNYNGTSMIFHRRGYDCSFPVDNLPCTLSASSITFKNLLGDFFLSSIHETSLTHTIVKRTLRPTDRISIAPMEISAFHFHF